MGQAAASPWALHLGRVMHDLGGPRIIQEALIPPDGWTHGQDEQTDGPD